MYRFDCLKNYRNVFISSSIEGLQKIKTANPQPIPRRRADQLRERQR